MRCFNPGSIGNNSATEPPKKVKFTKTVTTWDILEEVDFLLRNSPGWRAVDWKSYRGKLRVAFLGHRMTGDKKYLNKSKREARERFKRY